LRAAHGVQTDKKNKVIAWQDLALGPNRLSNDAFQPNPKSRPQYVPDVFNGHPAIRFDGSATHLITTPLTTTNDQTIVVVFQHAAPTSDGGRVGGQIVNYNGPPSRVLPDVRSPGVLQLGEKIDVWNGPLLSVAAKAFVGRDSRGADVSAGVVVSESLGSTRPHAVVYVYNNSQNNAALYVDGERVTEASAPTRVAVTSRKVIGKHGIFDQWYFRGDLSELVIFNSALRPAEIKALSHQLIEYYGIVAESGAKL
jgi:Concanavalin A-like lectin/glucanases superfamily